MCQSRQSLILHTGSPGVLACSTGPRQFPVLTPAGRGAPAPLVAWRWAGEAGRSVCFFHGVWWIYRSSKRPSARRLLSFDTESPVVSSIRGMMMSLADFARSLLDGNEREVRKLQRVVEQVNALEPEVLSLSDNQLRARGDQFTSASSRHCPTGLSRADRRTRTNIYRIAQETLNEMLPEVFAAVREASRRTPGPRPAAGSPARHAPLRRAVDGRRRAAPGAHRRDEDG